MPATRIQPEQIERAIEQRIAGGAKRFGYLLAAAINAVMLWVSHQLLEWEWPGFLTPEFDDLLPIVTLAFVASIVANLVYVWSDGWPVKSIGDAATSVIGFVVTLRTWQIFPFEFSGDDWSWLIRVILVIGMFGTAIGAVAGFATLAKGPPTTRDEQA